MIRGFIRDLRVSVSAQSNFDSPYYVPARTTTEVSLALTSEHATEILLANAKEEIVILTKDEYNELLVNKAIMSE